MEYIKTVPGLRSLHYGSEIIKKLNDSVFGDIQEVV